ncbi:MAG: serine/threonine protein kinase [Calditrichaeota bacterium]|nr:serine/threonine protein kinase [Calditrichota bacterium]MCB9369125.1 serine/threonine protein kinase [Calditrichota bacterium]
MKLDDDALSRLQEVIDEPDLSQTKYRLVTPLGQGGMGSVFVAEDTVLKRNVALKVLRVHDKQGEFVRRMNEEAQIAAKLEHPGIIPVHDLGTLPDGRVFYVTKFVQGMRLDEFAAKTEPVAERLRVFLKVCDAVAYAHSKDVLHRDLKPANIMVGGFGEVLILDWGTAREAHDDSPYTSAHGTMGYMPPEQQSGAAIDSRADVFALGATLFHLLTRSDPAHGILREHLRGLPNPLTAIIRKATAADKVNRYTSVSEFSSDVLHFLDGDPVEAYRESLLEKIGRQVSRHRFIIIILLTYIVIRLIFYLALRR